MGNNSFIKKDLIFKNFIIWSLVCTINATYSFYIAYDMGFNIWAMIFGILIFIALYTALASSTLFLKLKKNKILYKAFITGFFIKFLTIYYTDIIAGQLSVSIVSDNFVRPKDFINTLFITMTEGLILNILLWTIITLIYFVFLFVIFLLPKRAEYSN
ncbi:MAG: hypothetical protein GY714_21720 [Desulfobacterales bacterium]|nr:hypothetical protein [Desulfobacterales bacterium]